MERSFTHGITGSTNLQLGLNTLQNATTGSNNTAFGSETYRYLTAGSYNSGFGYGIVNGLSGNPNSNSDFGSIIGPNLSTATDVVAGGYLSIANLTIGTNNVAFGNNTGATLVDGINNVLFGNYCDTLASSNDTTLVGSLALGMQGNNSTILGNRRVVTYTNQVFSVGFDGETDQSSSVVFIGNKTGGPNDSNNSDSIIVGHRICYVPPGNFGGTSGTVIIGNDALGNSPTGIDTVVVGSQAGENADGFLFTIIGCQAGQGLSPYSAFFESVTMGFRANGTGGNLGTIIGAYAAETYKTGFLSTAIGYKAYQYADGVSNTAMGYCALKGATSVSVPDIANGTAVGANKLTSVMKILDFSTVNPEISDIDFTGATPAGLNGKYFLISSLAGDFYVWYNTEFTGTDPMVVNRIGIEIRIYNTYSSSDIAYTSSFALNSSLIGMQSGYSNAARVLDVENIGNGNVTDIGPGTAVSSPNQILSVVKLADGTAITPELNRIDFGVVKPGLLQGKYFLISSVFTDYYVWYSFDGNGPDPMVVGRTGIEVTLFNYYNSSDVYNNTMYALNGTGEFNSYSRSGEFLRVYTSAFASYNSALGVNAMLSCLAGELNTVVGVDAATAFIGGSENTVVGKNASLPVNCQRNTVVGFGASSTSDQCIVMGRNASSTALAGTVFGAEAVVTTPHGWQFGKAVALGTARMKFQNQIICDETWIGGGLTDLKIDTNGNFIRGLHEDNLVTTTNASATVIYTLPVIPTNTGVRLEASILGRRTGGSAGAVNDTAAYIMIGVIKNTGGVISITAPPTIIVEDQPAWNVDFFNSVGTTVVIRVFGAVNNTINWEARVRRLAI